ncbi:MAG: hypothetical protein ACRYGM_03455 [Janthinobacterium lividum]
MQLPTSSTRADAVFGLQIPVADAVPHPAWQRATTASLASLRRGRSVVVLGPPGTGKTFLLQSLALELGRAGLRTRGFVPSHTLRHEAETDVLLVDEGDKLPDSVLAALQDQDGLFVIAGLPGLTLDEGGQPLGENGQPLGENGQPRGEGGRPLTTVRLDPLPPEDVARFVAARLSATGQRRDLLEPDAVLALARHSGGLVRLVVMLAGSAVFLAEHEGAARVGKRHVDEAAALRDVADDAAGPDPAAGPAAQHARPRRRLLPLALGLAAALLLLLGWVLMEHGPAAPPTRRVVQAPASIPARPAVPLPQAVAPAAVVPAPMAPAPASPDLVAPDPVGPGQAEASLTFRGPILNETMNQGGQLALVLRRRGRAVVAGFQASAGLIGTGELTGHITAEGHLTLSGRLMMGRNPFDAVLSATLTGDVLTGTASFARPSGASATNSSFRLTRS